MAADIRLSIAAFDTHHTRFTPPRLPRNRDGILQVLAAGVVPRAGLRHIQVGRAGEIGALVEDMDRIEDGGAAIRFVIGEYGAGKTFFLNLVRLPTIDEAEAALDLADHTALEAEPVERKTRFDDQDERSRDVFSVHSKALDRVEAVGTVAKIEEENLVRHPDLVHALTSIGVTIRRAP